MQMVKQPSKIPRATAEYPDGHIQDNIYSIKGLRHKNWRPAYITLTVDCTEEDFEWGEQAKWIVYSHAPSALSSGSTVRGRIILKPLWFHNLVNKKGN